MVKDDRAKNSPIIKGLAEGAKDEARLRFLAETTGDVLYQLRYDDMVYDYFSPGMVRLTGYTIQEINEMSFSKLVMEVDSPDGAGVDLKEIRRNRKEGRTGEVQLDYLLRCKDGTYKWVSDHSFPYYGQNGMVIGSVGILRDITRRKELELERQRLVAELKEALAQVKSLQGLLPICANCKKVRNDEGYWQQIEYYLAEHSDAEFSHGLCPDCVEKLYPELAEIRKNNRQGGDDD